MLKQAHFYFGILLSVMLLATACQSSRKTSDPYGYLRRGNKRLTPKTPQEPYEIVDIAVLDTAKTQTQTPTHTQTPTPTPTPSNTKPKVDPPIEIGLPAKSILVILSEARSYIGTPYLYGGTSKQGIDCSGLVFASYLSIEMTVPRTSRALAVTGKNIKRKKIKPGDLIFFSSRMDGKINHVGMATQVNGTEIRFIHATVSKGVREDRLDVGYWSERFMKAGRVG